MPWFIPLFFRRFLRDDGRRRRFVTRRRRRFVARRMSDVGERRRFGVGNYIGRRGAGGYRARRHGGRFCGQGIRNRSGAAPPPTGAAPTPTPSALADAYAVAPGLPSPTPAVVRIEGDALAYVSTPTGATMFTIGSGVRTSSSAPAAPRSSPRADADAPLPPSPSPTPATPPPSPRSAARRGLLALGLPLSGPSADSPPRRRGRRAGTRSPATLGLASSASNGVAPGTRLPGGSSDEEERGQSAALRW